VVHGAPVRVSGDVGPAVAGALRPQVVLPAWALDDPRLPVMLAHERAHVRAGDPLLLAAARAAAALLPWHPAVWWQLRRLRAAVEVDCDRRVLRARAADARAYGALLLDVAARPTAALPVLAMASSPTLLRRRIDVITTRRPAHALLRAAVPATLAAALVALACETPRPTGPRPVARVPLTQVVPAADAVPEGHVSAADVRDVLAAHAPDLLQTATGRSRRLWVVQEADGRVSRVEHGLEADLVQPVHELRASRITPGANGTARVTTQGATRELVAVMRPGAIATVEPSRIAAMEVMRLAPGRVTPDGLHVIWLRLRAAGETGATSVLVPSVATAAVPGARGSATAGRPSYRLTVRASGRTIDAVPLDAAAPSAGPVALRLSADSASHGPPLYVIDGRIVTRVAGAGAPDDPMATLAPDSIERVGVLKGESARHKYGAAGANGVVEITTKAGAAAAPQAP
jgi:TonB-dependent SusC/RagA subfamily outer membrane receptor